MFEALTVCRSNMLPVMMREEATVNGGPAAYIGSLISRYQVLGVYDEFVVEAAEKVEPFDPVLGRDLEAPTGYSFLRGELAGLRAVEKCFGGKFLEGLGDTRLPCPDKAVTKGDKEAGEHLMAETFLHLGDKGLDELHEETRKMLGEWSEEAVKEVRYQRYFPLGFGFVAFAAGRLVQQIDSEAMAREIESASTVDWSKLLV